jgi:hypothetical protein
MKTILIFFLPSLNVDTISVNKPMVENILENSNGRKNGSSNRLML